MSLAGKVKTQATTREVTREVMKPRLSDLIDAINKIIIDAERELGKRILVIIDDLDKMNLKMSEELFYKHGVEFLLLSLAILEYENGEIWYDIHPTIKGIIERVETGEG